MLLSILVKQFDTYCTGYLRSGKAERGCVSYAKKMTNVLKVYSRLQKVLHKKSAINDKSHQKKMEKRRSGTQSSQAGLKTTKVMSTFIVTMSQDSNELPNNLQ